MQNLETRRIVSPEMAVNALALAAYTARQTFCFDEPPLPTLLSEMSWCAEEIAARNALPASVMDAYRRIVFSEHPIDARPLSADELRDTQAAMSDFIRQTQAGDPGDRILDGISGWDELLAAIE